MLKGQLLSSMGSFVLGGSVALVGLLAWTGGEDLQQIKDSVQTHVSHSQDVAMELINEYNVVVDEANAEIGEYKVALNQANDNIFQLAKAYEEQQATYEADMADLQAEYDEMVARLEQQYEADMNAVIEQANAEIQKANEEVAQAKEEVQRAIGGSAMDIIVNNEERNELDTTGDKSVADVVLPDITPEDQPQE